MTSSFKTSETAPVLNEIQTFCYYGYNCEDKYLLTSNLDCINSGWKPQMGSWAVCRGGGLHKQRSLYSKPRSKSSCGEEEKERGNVKEEVRELLADGLHRFPMREITAHAWTDPSIGWHLDLIHTLLIIKETYTGGVREEKYITLKKDRQSLTPIDLHPI